MTQMESPKRKMQKKNDYQRHKLFRKIKRRRKAQAEADQQVAMKQLRKKLKLPKFDRGEDELSTYKKQVEMFNDANSDPTLPGRLVDINRITVNPETGDVIETGGHVNLDPVIITGKMPDNLKRTINKNIESNRLQDLLYKDRLSPVDPIGELVVESAAIGKPLELAGKAALYGIGRYGVEKTKDPYIYKYKNITFSDIRPQNAGIDKNGNFGFLDLIIHDYNSGKDIRIKPSKRGTFTKAAKQHGMSVQGFANKVLKNPSKYSATMRKKANFAHNAASWKH